MRSQSKRTQVCPLLGVQVYKLSSFTILGAPPLPKGLYVSKKTHGICPLHPLINLARTPGQDVSHFRSKTHSFRSFAVISVTC